MAEDFRQTIKKALGRDAIVKAPDVLKNFTWADFGTDTERITEIEYVSATQGTATKTYTYTNVGGVYRIDTITWVIS